MIQVQASELIPIWYQALVEPVGVLISTNSPGKMRQKLYEARTKAGDPELQGLQLRTVDLPGGQLVIVKASVVEAFQEEKRQRLLPASLEEAGL